MKKINWLVRIKNKAFGVAFIPAVLLLIQVIASVFGIQIDLGNLGNKLLEVVNAVFSIPPIQHVSLVYSEIIKNLFRMDI